MVGGLTVTSERQKLVDFSEPVFTGAREVLVTGPGAPPIRNMEGLQGQTAFVREASSFYEHLRSINDSLQREGRREIGKAFVEDRIEDEDIPEMANAGCFPWRSSTKKKGVSGRRCSAASPYATILPFMKGENCLGDTQG